jgi:plastocyanin
MIWRWDTFSSVRSALLKNTQNGRGAERPTRSAEEFCTGWRCASAPFALFVLLFCASLSGTELRGRIQLVDSENPAVNKRNDLSGVIVWLMNKQNNEFRKSSRHAEMLQKDKRFVPHVMVIATGSTVDFPNLDPIFHNAFSNFDGTIFDVALYPPATSRSVVFDRPGIVRVFCNIHPSMSAIIVVVDSPYFAATERNGDFVIPNVAPGDYDIHFFHERAVPETLAKLTKNIEVRAEPVQLPSISISEAGYLPVAHKNKYGRDYPEGADQTGYKMTPLK